MSRKIDLLAIERLLALLQASHQESLSDIKRLSAKKLGIKRLALQATVAQLPKQEAALKVKAVPACPSSRPSPRPARRLEVSDGQMIAWLYKAGIPANRLHA